jgi:hypothetical protein
MSYEKKSGRRYFLFCAGGFALQSENFFRFFEKYFAVSKKSFTFAFGKIINIREK